MPAIVKLSREARPEDIEMLRLFEDGGIAVDAALQGGVPRDIALGLESTIHDYDVWGSFAPATDINQPGFVADLTRRLAALPGVTQVKMIGYDPAVPNKSPYTGVKFEVEWQNRTIELLLDNLYWSPSEKIYKSDAPINAVIINSAGETWAHPDHEDHLVRRYYAPFSHASHSEDRIRERFAHLQAKIPGLTTDDPRCKPPGGSMDCEI